MGRPIQKKWFGPPSSTGAQIVVNGVKWADGTTASNAYIVKQTGSNAYIVSNGIKSEIVFMVNATAVSGLSAGECYILATPFGGSARPCKKINQFRLDLFEADGSINSYSWSTVPAVANGQANLVAANGGNGQILYVTVTNGGRGYFSAPSVTFTGGGSGATGTAVIAAGVVTGVTVTAGGSGYTSGTMTLAAPPASVTATGTVTLSGNTVGSIAVNTQGGYYTTAPAVTINGNGAGATATATIANGRVTGFVVTNAGSGYTAATVTVAAPPAAVTATATATPDL